MINKDSIVTAYDEHLTLVEWLQKVETALKDAVLTGVTINKKGNATLSFVFTFEDGTTLETDDLILQQGESVQSATIRNGHLILTLTNGDELDVGDLGGVNGFSIDASQHLIVTYQNGTTQDLGAIFDGTTIKVNTLTSDNAEISTLKPVIEVMNDYHYYDLGASGVTKEVTYAGVCKNGNKLTIAVALYLTINEAVSAIKPLFGITMPSQVANKLVGATIAGYPNVLTFIQSNFYEVATQAKNVTCQIFKSADGIRVECYPSALTVGTRYYGRIEVTFLLSDNAVA